jgi:hypothetical protein
MHAPCIPTNQPLLLRRMQEQELEAMKARLADMEKEAAKLKEMQVRLWLDFPFNSLHFISSFCIGMHALCRLTFPCLPEAQAHIQPCNSLLTMLQDKAQKEAGMAPAGGPSVDAAAKEEADSRSGEAANKHTGTACTIHKAADLVEGRRLSQGCVGGCLSAVYLTLHFFPFPFKYLSPLAPCAQCTWAAWTTAAPLRSCKCTSSRAAQSTESPSSLVGGAQSPAWGAVGVQSLLIT